MVDNYKINYYTSKEFIGGNLIKRKKKKWQKNILTPNQSY